MTIQATTDRSISPRWLPVIRIAWLLYTLMLIVAFVAGVPYRYAALANTCMGDCPSLTLTPAEAMLIEQHGASLTFYATLQLGIELPLAVVYTALAVFIFWKRSHTWTGIFVSLPYSPWEPSSGPKKSAPWSTPPQFFARPDAITRPSPSSRSCSFSISSPMAASCPAGPLFSLQYLALSCSWTRLHPFRAPRRHRPA